MTNETKLVKDVFKDYESRGNIKDSIILNVSILKKSNKLIIDLKSDKKIQVGEKLEFEYYLKSKFIVEEVQINIETEEVKEKTTVKGEKVQDEHTPIIIGNKKAKISEKIIKVKDINIDSGRVAITGKIIKQDLRELKTGNYLLSINVFDGTSTITCKTFINKEDKDRIVGRIDNSPNITVSGDAEFDPYAKEVVVKAKTVIEANAISENKRKDLSKEKRVELHMHTQMSQMDGVSSAEDLINRARSWGMKAISITDHGVVQSFPIANHVVEDNEGDIKVIYGVEAYLVPDGQTSVYGSKNQDIDTEY